MKFKAPSLIAVLFFSVALASLAVAAPVKSKQPPKSAPPAARSVQPPAKSTSQPTDPAVLTVEARSAVLVEVSTGKRLFEQNQDLLIEPASFTKVLTLYLVFDALRKGQIRLQDEVFISENAWRTGGSKMFVGVGSKVPLDDLLKGVAVVSGNDACVALAEHLDGSVDAFVANMNRKAQELGMTQSVFHNPHGLPVQGQITTANDMAALAIAYLRRFPEALNYHSMREYTYNEITQYNRNHLLLKDQSVDGLKTGFVEASGYHLTATAKRDGMRLVAVVMGAERPSIREREALKVLNHGFRRYALVNPFTLEQPLASVRVWKGVADQLNLFPAELGNVLVPFESKNSVRLEVDAPKELNAPVKAQQQIGKVNLYVGEPLLRSIALISQEDIAVAGWAKRIWQQVLRIHTLNWKAIGIGMLGFLALVLLIVLFSRVRPGSRAYRPNRPKRY